MKKAWRIILIAYIMVVIATGVYIYLETQTISYIYFKKQYQNLFLSNISVLLSVGSLLFSLYVLWRSIKKPSYEGSK